MNINVNTTPNPLAYCNEFEIYTVGENLGTDIHYLDYKDAVNHLLKWSTSNKVISINQNDKEFTVKAKHSNGNEFFIYLQVKKVRIY